MGRWLEHDPYRQWAECPDGFEPIAGYTMNPTVLAPTPLNAEFALGLFHELLGNFTSQRVNVDCDETFDLGHGVSRDLVAREGKARVYIDHLKRIVDPLTRDGYSVHYWADIVRKDPTFARELPETATPVCWTYEAPGPGAELPDSIRPLLESLGVDLPDEWGFEENTAPIAESGAPFWVAPGTSAWDSLVGRIDNATGNLLDAAEVGHARGATGYLITDWGDNGHLQPPSVSFGPLLYGGAVAWCHRTNAALDVAEVLDQFAFDDPSGRLGPALVELGRQWNRTGVPAANGSPLQHALVPSAMGLDARTAPDPDGMQEVLDTIEHCMERIADATPRCIDADLVVSELIQAATLARHGGWRLLAREGARCPTVMPCADDLTRAIDGQRAAWLARARPGGLPESIGRLERTLREYGPQ